MKKKTFGHVSPARWLMLGFMLIVIFALCDLKCGAMNYSWHDLIAAIQHPGATDETTINIMQVRLPMVLMAMMAGSGLAIAGLLLQRVTQNPLACPSLSGIEYGAALSVIISHMLMPQIVRPAAISVAVLGGLLTYFLMQAIVKKIGASTLGITLIGVAFNSLYYSVIQAVLLAFPYHAQAILYDLNGSLHGVTMHDIQFICLPFIALMMAAFLLAKRLDLLDLDEFQANTLGVAIHQYRLFLLGLSILLATLLTSIIGPLLFFGLVIPHLVKPLTHKSYHLMFFCAVFGAAFLLIAEFMTRIVSPQTPPPVGIIMLLMAAPLLLFITRRYVAYDQS
ncbi:FecCD family ABC transporter permease [Aquicella lusitana]|nr:iron ABC transporter permease [Aquicella lusitana]